MDFVKAGVALLVLTYLVTFLAAPLLAPFDVPRARIARNESSLAVVARLAGTLLEPPRLREVTP
jgi:hypothetical protein